MVRDSPVSADVGIRESPIERNHQGHAQQRIAERILADLVDAVEQRIHDRERQAIELIAGEISESWLEGHAVAGTLRPLSN